METVKGVPTAWPSELRRNLGPKAAHLLVPSAGAEGVPLKAGASWIPGSGPRAQGSACPHSGPGLSLWD